MLHLNYQILSSRPFENSYNSSEGATLEGKKETKFKTPIRKSYRSLKAFPPIGSYVGHHSNSIIIKCSNGPSMSLESWWPKLQQKKDNVKI